MRWRGAERRAAIILGAGATLGAIGTVLVKQRHISPPLNCNFFSIAEAFAKTQSSAYRERLKRLKRFFAQGYGIRGQWPLPMETAFSRLYAAKDFPAIYTSGAGRRPQGGRQREVEDFLRLTTSLLCAIERSIKDGQNGYDGLVSSLGGDDCLISLNYDTALDSSLIRAGWRPEKGYGLAIGKGRFKWTMQNKPHLSQRLACVRLLKLHGCSNWYVRTNRHHKSVEKIFTSKPSKVIVSATPKINEPGAMLRQIVPPIYGKFFAHDHWKALWTKAYEALVKSELLIVIGCSLQESDFHLWGTIRHAAQTRKSATKPFHEVIVVDKKGARERWRGLLAGCAPKFNANFTKFEKFLDSSALGG